MKKVFFAILLIFILFFPLLLQAKAQQGQDQYSLEVQGFTWNRTTLQALIVEAANESWWNEKYVNSVLRAINKWNEAIAFFSANYSDYAYLSSVKIDTQISIVTQPNFDVYVAWTKSPLSNASDEIGLAKTITDPYRTIENCTITLAIETNHGYSLTERDIQNVFLHELGHGLGLGHSNATGDLMYPMYTLRGSDESVSTLDVYGVATIFSWILNPSEFYPVNDWLNRRSVTLPETIEYQYIASSAEDNPPQTIFDNPVMQVIILMVQILLHPQILFIVIVLTLIFIIIGLIPKRRNRK